MRMTQGLDDMCEHAQLCGLLLIIMPTARGSEGTQRYLVEGSGMNEGDLRTEQRNQGVGAIV